MFQNKGPKAQTKAKAKARAKDKVKTMPKAEAKAKDRGPKAQAQAKAKTEAKVIPKAKAKEGKHFVETGRTLCRGLAQEARSVGIGTRRTAETGNRATARKETIVHSFIQQEQLQHNQ